ncbi:MerR family transcriptional regulator [Nocardia australiensis]|uniref:MerR family transcriptional regulator n=1 Tax=Nocardia australiensis TaxID=2887191 RepID=UPI001D14E6D9|nr:MerR family transcriptional regulator [Nocardia australiensis]
MRIKELADAVGITTRAVRHYHRIGLLPEPPRQPNGYRQYSLRDAVELARIRRLTELGLSLDEVRDVLAEDVGKDLADILGELDADLARQEESIRQRRARLAQLLRQAEADGRLSDEAPVSPALAALFHDMSRACARHPGPEPAMVVKERELLALLETSVPDGGRGWLDGMIHALRADPEVIARSYEVYAQLDELLGAHDGDPRVETAACAIVSSMPEGIREAMKALGGQQMNAAGEGGFAEAFFADFAPAQAAAIRRAIQLLQEPTR